MKEFRTDIYSSIVAGVVVLLMGTPIAIASSYYDHHSYTRRPDRRDRRPIVTQPDTPVDYGATPADYGFAVPSPQPPLPNAFDIFNPPLMGGSFGPVVSESTKTADRDETIIVTGAGFSSSQTDFRFFGQTSADDAQTIDTQAMTMNEVGAVITLPDTLPDWSMYLMWGQTAGQYGLPIAVNRTEAWWLGPHRVMSCDDMSVYGRNLSYRNGSLLSWVYVKPVGTNNGEWADVSEVNPYRVSFTFPGCTSPGQYEVWVHNGHGGEFGWSGPLELTVLSQSPWAGQSSNLFNVKDYGAQGDGITDDHAAINAALDAASHSAPATVYFPAGSYLVSGELNPVNNVSWLGDGRDQSHIKAHSNFGSSNAYALIFSDWSAVNNIEFKDLTIDGNGNLGGKSLFVFRNHSNIRMDSIRLDYRELEVQLGIYNLQIVDSEFIGPGVFLGNSRQVIVDNSIFKLTDNANSALISWGGWDVAITNNLAQDLDSHSLSTSGRGRFFVSQGRWGSMGNFYIANNTTVNLAPLPDAPDQNVGEQILFEMGGIMAWDYVESASPDTVALPYDIPVLTQRAYDAVIMEGKGIGQRRLIIDYDPSNYTMTVWPEWNIIPDTSSVITVTPVMANVAVYLNNLDGKDGYADRYTASAGIECYSNCFNVVVDSNNITNVRNGLYIADLVPNEFVGSFFNLFTGNTIANALIGVYNLTNYSESDFVGIDNSIVGHFGNVFRHNSMSNIGDTYIMDNLNDFNVFEDNIFH